MKRMHTVQVETRIDAPLDRCFDLARSVDAHVASAEGTGERAVAGRRSGLLVLGEEVTWEARHLGIRQRLTSRITAFERPTFFQDRMVRGAFAELEHDHLFQSPPGGGTRMVDVLRFRAPFGLLGRGVGRWVLAPHLRRFLIQRGLALKALAESDQWQRYLLPASEMSGGSR